MAHSRDEEVNHASSRPPATTVDGREKQMINLAISLAEKQLREGTAATPIIAHYLKLATVREEMERDNLRASNKLLEARVEALASSANTEELTRQAIEAFTTYKPSSDDGDDLG